MVCPPVWMVSPWSGQVCLLGVQDPFYSVISVEFTQPEASSNPELGPGTGVASMGGQ